MTAEIRRNLDSFWLWEGTTDRNSAIMLNKDQEPRGVDVDHVLTVDYESSIILALDINPDDILIAVGSH